MPSRMREAMHQRDARQLAIRILIGVTASQCPGLEGLAAPHQEFEHASAAYPLARRTNRSPAGEPVRPRLRTLLSLLYVVARSRNSPGPV